MSNLQNSRAQHTGEKLLPFFILPVVFKTITPPPTPPRSPRPKHTLNPESTTFIPSYAAQLQATEPFWHQFTPGLHYSPFAGITRDMDRQTVEQGRWDANPQTAQQDRRPHTMVKVYNDGEFIMSVPIHVLRRFSGVARRKFPEAPIPTPLGKGNAGPLTQGDTNTFTASRTESERPPTLKPALETYGSVLNVEQLKLDLQLMGVEYNPSNEIVRHTLNWMMNNAEAEEFVSPWVSNPHALEFEDLVDKYMAALVLDLMPYPVMVRKAMMEYISRRQPGVRLFRELFENIPVTDGTMDRAMNLYHDHQEAERYTPEEHKAIEDFIESEEPLKQRRDFIFKAIRERTQDQRSDDAFGGWRGHRGDHNLLSDNWRQGGQPSSLKTESYRQPQIEPSMSRKTAGAERVAGELEQAMSEGLVESTRRRRDRRGQQTRYEENWRRNAGPAT